MKLIEKKRDDFEISPNAYCILYNDKKDKFEISFGVANEEEIFVHSNTVVTPNDFKRIFHSMLDSMIDYSKKKNPKFLEECIGEYTKKKGD